MRSLIAVATLALLAACSSPSPYKNAEIGGNVTYRQRIIYGPDATLVVYLVDASGPETPLEIELQKLDDPTPGAELLAVSTTEGMITSPTKFSLPVPLDKIDESHDYALKAAILDQGKPVMASKEPPLVLTKGRPFQVEVEVSPLGN